MSEKIKWHRVAGMCEKCIVDNKRYVIRDKCVGGRYEYYLQEYDMSLFLMKRLNQPAGWDEQKYGDYPTALFRRWYKAKHGVKPSLYFWGPVADSNGGVLACNIKPRMLVLVYPKDGKIRFIDEGIRRTGFFEKERECKRVAEEYIRQQIKWMEENKDVR